MEQMPQEGGEFRWGGGLDFPTYPYQNGGMLQVPEAPLDEYKKGGWIQKATASIKRRGTEGVCTGSKFGGPSCPPGSKRYNLAKTFKAMAKHEDGGFIDSMPDVNLANYEMGGMLPEFGDGGYTVTRSNERKGKTHKVTGPDGTVKFFGDPDLKNNPSEKAKDAFYARHKKNLEGNPHFRAYARATWRNGGYMPQYADGGYMNEGGDQTGDPREFMKAVYTVFSKMQEARQGKRKKYGVSHKEWNRNKSYQDYKNNEYLNDVKNIVNLYYTLDPEKRDYYKNMASFFESAGGYGMKQDGTIGYLFDFENQKFPKYYDNLRHEGQPGKNLYKILNYQNFFNSKKIQDLQNLFPESFINANNFVEKLDLAPMFDELKIHQNTAIEDGMHKPQNVAGKSFFAKSFNPVENTFDVGYKNPLKNKSFGYKNPYALNLKTNPFGQELINKVGQNFEPVAPVGTEPAISNVPQFQPMAQQQPMTQPMSQPMVNQQPFDNRPQINIPTFNETFSAPMNTRSMFTQPETMATSLPMPYGRKDPFQNLSFDDLANGFNQQMQTPAANQNVETTGFPASNQSNVFQQQSFEDYMQGVQPEEITVPFNKQYSNQLKMANGTQPTDLGENPLRLRPLEYASIGLKGLALGKSMYDALQPAEKEQLRLNREAGLVNNMMAGRNVNLAAALNEAMYNRNAALASNQARSANVQRALDMQTYTNAERNAIRAKLEERAMNNALRAEEANTRMNLGAMEAAERIRRQNIQSQNEAAQRDFGRQFFSDLSNVGNQLYKAQMYKDMYKNKQDLFANQFRESVALLKQVGGNWQVFGKNADAILEKLRRGTPLTQEDYDTAMTMIEKASR